jgi:hypothetical protein
MVGFCMNCGAPIPKGSRASRKFDTEACRAQFWRRRHSTNHPPPSRVKLPPNPIDAQHKVAASTGTGDPDIDAILNLPYEATLRVTLLRELLDRKKTQWQREQFEKDQQEKEVTVLDPELARRTARILAHENYAS